MSEARTNVIGTVYLLHFDRPLKHARHYLGWTEDLHARLKAHASGNGSRLMEVVSEAGIDYTLARTWENVTREKERSLKNTGGLSRQCPICKSAGKDSRKNWREEQQLLKTVAWG